MTIIIQKIPNSCILLNTCCFNTLNNFEDDILFKTKREEFYKNYFNQNILYDFSKYYESIDEKYMNKDIKVIPVSLFEIDELINLSNLFQISGKKELDDNHLLLLSVFIKKIDNALNSLISDSFVFARFDSCSMKDSFIKHNSGVKTSKEIIYQIISSKRCYDMLLVYKKYKCPTNLILKKFDNSISITNEYRIFIKNRKIKCVSQYDWTKNLELTTNLIFELDLEIRKLDEQIKKIPFDSCILDIHFKDNIIKIIECNPFGSKSPSGSALFNWERDYFIIEEDHDEIYYRIVSD